MNWYTYTWNMYRSSALRTVRHMHSQRTRGRATDQAEDVSLVICHAHGLIQYFVPSAWLPLAVLITTFLFTLIFYTTYKADSSTKLDAFFVCNDNGYVEKTEHNYNPL